MRRTIVLTFLFLLMGCQAPRDVPVAQAPPSPTAPPPSATATLSPTASATASPSRTPTATHSPTATATASATATPTAEPTPTVALTPVADAVDLTAMGHDYQRLNNCGPTSTAMALSIYGLTLTQYDIAPLVKGSQQDTNASPYELSAFIQDQGLRAPVLVNGDLDTLRALLANGIPVIVEQWLVRPDDELTAHYRTVRGYDRAAGLFIVNDSYLGPNLRYREAEFDEWWRAFHRLYLPVYQPEQEPIVRAIVGERLDDERVMWTAALARAEAEVASDRNLYSLYNAAEASYHLDDLEGAIERYEASIALGWPPRLAWYRFTHLDALIQAQRYERVLQLTAGYGDIASEELPYYRGLALEGLGRPQEALAEYRRALALNGHMQAAAEAIARLDGGG